MAPTKSNGAALYVDEDGSNRVVRDMPKPEPGAGEILVEVQYSGCNIADVDHAMLGINSTVMGYDFMGKVCTAGPGSPFAVGDLVAGYTPTGIGRPAKYGAHQPFLVAPEDQAWRVPHNVPHSHAAALTVVVATAADALYNAFEFPFPGDKTLEEFKSGPLLIWGGSTSVGIAIIQLARASGAHPIFVTASPKRHDLLKSLGAAQCFDYSDPHVIAKITAAVDDEKVGSVLYAADCTGSPEAAQKVAAIASKQAKLVSLRGQQDGRFTMPFGNKSRDMELHLPAIDRRVLIPAQPAQQARMWKGLKWAVHHYGSAFSMPSVNIFGGTAEDALDKVRAVAEGGNFGRLVLKHPLV
ncbi:putative Alcohol dehydrogenase [Seiridium cardinale]